MKNSTKWLRGLGFCLTLGLASLANGSLAQTPAIIQAAGQSGQYGAMTVGISGAGDRVTGHYESDTGWDETLNAPRFSCIFYFSGERNGDRYDITSWSPGQPQDTIAGKLSFSQSNRTSQLRLQLNEDHGGCWNVQPFDGAGSQLSLTRSGNWTSVRTVANQRAYFHRQPDGSTQRKSYVIAGDVLKIYETRGGWVDAEFGSERITRGWIKISDLTPSN